MVRAPDASGAEPRSATERASREQSRARYPDRTGFVECGSGSHCEKKDSRNSS